MTKEEVSQILDGIEKCKRSIEKSFDTFMEDLKIKCLGCGSSQTTHCDNTLCDDCWSRENE